MDDVGMGQVGRVQHLDPVGIGHETVAELNRDAVRMMQLFVADHAGDLWARGIIQINDNQSRVTTDVGVGTRRS